MAILREENRKLKSTQSSRAQPVDNKTPSKREMAALSTEYDLLTKKVQDLKAFIKQNENVQANDFRTEKGKESGLSMQ